MHKTPFLKTVPFLLLAAMLSCVSCDAKGAGGGGIAPDFSLKDTSGRMVSLRDHRGQYVIIDFWATWCPPCLHSIPELVALHRKYRDKGLVVLGINLDDPGKVDSRALARFKDQHRIDYTILVASDKVVRDYSSLDGMALPTMFFVDREGRLVERLVGFAPGRVEKSIRRLMG
jgi:peroxiredoxin